MPGPPKTRPKRLGLDGELYEDLPARRPAMSRVDRNLIALACWLVAVVVGGLLALPWLVRLGPYYEAYARWACGCR